MVRDTASGDVVRDASLVAVGAELEIVPQKDNSRATVKSVHFEANRLLINNFTRSSSWKICKNLETLEKLTADIKRDDISLEDALKDFEMGTKLRARHGSRNRQDRRKKFQMLMNEPAPESADTPELDLFSGTDEATGTAGAPQEGTRQ